MSGDARRLVVAYLDEPPFCLPAGPGARPSGCDMDVADRVLGAAGVGAVDYALTTFPELIPGLVGGRWQMTTAMFVTDERAELVDFGRPLWAATDGFVVRRADADRLTGYEAIARTPDAVLAVVTGQVQHRTALAAGVPSERIAEFPDQDAAAAAVRDGRADTSASTGIGSAAYVRRAGDGALAAVPDRPEGPRPPLPRGAFAFAKEAPELRAAVDAALAGYLGSAEHVALMAGYGFPEDDLRAVL